MKIISSALRTVGSALLVAVLAVLFIGMQDTVLPKTTILPKTTLIGSAGASSPDTYFQPYGSSSNGSAIAGANHTSCSGLLIPNAGLSVGHISFHVGTGDGGGAVRSDVGIYNSAGTLEANIGATSLGSTGDQFIAILGGTKSITAGIHLACFTSTGTTLNLSVLAGGPTFYVQQDAGFTTSGGALNGSVAFPTIGSSTISQQQSALEILLYP